MKRTDRSFQMSRPGALLAAVFVLAALARTADAKAASPQPALTDREIARYVLDADAYEREAALLARDKATTPDVRQLAERPDTDHASLDRDLKPMGVSAPHDALEEDLATRSQERLGWLQLLQGDQFEETYADYEVSFDSSLLDALDKHLIPDAKDGQLKARLQQLRSEMADHMADAKRVQEEVGKRRMFRDAP